MYTDRKKATVEQVCDGWMQPIHIAGPHIHQYISQTPLTKEQRDVSPYHVGSPTPFLTTVGHFIKKDNPSGLE